MKNKDLFTVLTKNSCEIFTKYLFFNLETKYSHSLQKDEAVLEDRIRELKFGPDFSSIIRNCRKKIPIYSRWEMPRIHNGGF